LARKPYYAAQAGQGISVMHSSIATPERMPRILITHDWKLSPGILAQSDEKFFSANLNLGLNYW